MSVFTEEELREAGLLGHGYVAHALAIMEKYPKLRLSLFTLECVNYDGHRKSLSSSAPPTFGDTSASVSRGVDSVATKVSQYSPSQREKTTYYHGLCVNHPHLLYRSNYLVCPFPPPKGPIQYIPPKSVRGVFNTPLNPVWHTVAPKIRDVLKGRGIPYSAIHAARFLTHGEDGYGKDHLGPVVIWIAVRPGTTSAEDAHFASLDILALLDAHGVSGVVVEWIEAVVEKLARPPLLRVPKEADPTRHIRRFLTAGLGMPIATAEREDSDLQGSVAFFFHETKDRDGKPSDRVLGVSNSHVLSKNPAHPYQYRGPGAAPQYVRIAGFRRFQRGLDEIKYAISSHALIVILLAEEIMLLDPKIQSEDAVEAAEAADAVKAKQERFGKLEKDIATLEAFHQEVSSQWGDIARRNIGHVDWAPAVDVDFYTKDIATFAVDAHKFKAHYKGNVIDLAGKYTLSELIDKFYRHSKSNNAFTYPPDSQLRINGCVPPEILANPDSFDNNGQPCLVVLKNGNTTDLTAGHYAGLEAYTCNELGVEAVELAIYDYDKQSGPFSAKGDSGSVAFDGRGRMVGVVHSGLAKGANIIVTYATPAWWAVEQLKKQYPHADLNRDRFQ